MKILLLNGSLAEKSHTKALLKHIETLLVNNGYKTIFWDLKNNTIPTIIPEYHSDPTKHPDASVSEFVRTIDEADAYIIGSPLYHGSYAGVLKNALDNLRYDAFRGKWIGLVGNGGSIRADSIQLLHLRNVVKTLFGYTLQTQIGTSRDDYEDSDDGYKLVSESIVSRCNRLVEELDERLNHKNQ